MPLITNNHNRCDSKERGMLLFAPFFLLLSITACKKLVQIAEPVTTITSAETFDNRGTAESAVIGIYSSMDPAQPAFNIGDMMTLYSGLSADEFNYFDGSDVNTMEFETNSLDKNNYLVQSFWTPVYSTIYRANAVLEGVNTSGSLSQTDKNQFIGEAEFLRAFSYFYLTNVFGDVPLVTTTNWIQTASMAQTPQLQVYQQIVRDLQNAENHLSADYSASGGERIRANKWAAAALLARVYLYTGNWAGADSASSAVLNNTATYNLLSNPDSTFLMNSNEAILQLQTYDIAPYSTSEGLYLIPPDNMSNPSWYLTDEQMAAFEPGDLREACWVDTTNYLGTNYYYPAKYKVRIGTAVSEYYMVLRFAEQYLIRAEAIANGAEKGDLTKAIADLNTIRTRATLNALPETLNKSQVLAAIEQERRVEFFSEWGNRWLDLKRWGLATSNLSAEKGITVDAAKLVYPIPPSELSADPNLKQNPGY